MADGKRGRGARVPGVTSAHESIPEMVAQAKAGGLLRAVPMLGGLTEEDTRVAFRGAVAGAAVAQTLLGGGPTYLSISDRVADAWNEPTNPELVRLDRARDNTALSRVTIRDGRFRTDGVWLNAAWLAPQRVQAAYLRGQATGVGSYSASFDTPNVAEAARRQVIHETAHQMTQSTTGTMRVFRAALRAEYPDAARMLADAYRVSPYAATSYGELFAEVAVRVAAGPPGAVRPGVLAAWQKALAHTRQQAHFVDGESLTPARVTEWRRDARIALAEL